MCSLIIIITSDFRCYLMIDRTYLDRYTASPINLFACTCIQTHLKTWSNLVLYQLFQVLNLSRWIRALILKRTWWMHPRVWLSRTSSEKVSPRKYLVYPRCSCVQALPWFLNIGFQRPPVCKVIGDGVGAHTFRCAHAIIKVELIGALQHCVSGARKSWVSCIINTPSSAPHLSLGWSYVQHKGELMNAG